MDSNSPVYNRICCILIYILCWQLLIWSTTCCRWSRESDTQLPSLLHMFGYRWVMNILSCETWDCQGDTVFLDLTCSLVDQHQCFRAVCCLYLQGNLKMEESGFPEMWIITYKSRLPCFLLVGVTVQPWRWKKYLLPKCWYSSIRWHDIVSYKIVCCS